MSLPSAKLLFLIQVSRPIIWPVLPLVYTLGLHSAHATVHAAVVIQALLLTFPMNLVGCGLNDIYDYDSDRLSSRRRAVWGTVVRAEDRPLVFRGTMLMVPLIVLGAFFTGNWDNIAATIALLLVAWLYSVPPLRLKERPPLDSLANGFGYFLLPFTMGYSLNADPRSMPSEYFLLALCVCGIHALATAADCEADRAAGHRTLAVKYGKRTAAVFAFITFMLAWTLGGFDSLAVRAYLAICAQVSLIAAILPRSIAITGACMTIFAGFVVAAICHVCGF